MPMVVCIFVRYYHNPDNDKYNFALKICTKCNNKFERMHAESKISIHHSSLVDLKAELLRKQAEVETAKAKLQNVSQFDKSKTKHKKSNHKQKKKEVTNNFKESEKEDLESIKIHKKSQLMLQAKSRLYKELSKTHTNMNPNFLVDFEQKPENSDHSEEEPCKEESDNNCSDYESDGEWVEYTDCFGRTRKCLREDLSKMQEKDESVKKTIVQNTDDRIKDSRLYFEDKLPERETEIEKMRRKWEEQTANLANKVDIHYQDVLFDEARTHGVGYYAFSQDEEERAKQQKDLFKLRKETEQKQKENQFMSDAKEKILQNRLRAAKLRQRIRLGLPPEPEEDIIKDSHSSSIPNEEVQEIVEDNGKCKEKLNETMETKNTGVCNKQEIRKNKSENDENKIQAFGDLLGKRNKWYVMSQEEWVQKKRKERINDFAPSYSNFLQDTSLNEHAVDKELSNESNISDDFIIGPMPPSLNEDNTKKPLPFSQDPILDTNINVEQQVEAGLRYLRKQFENKNT